MDDLQAAVERWSLTLGKPYEHGAAGFTTRATLLDGTPVVTSELGRDRERARGWTIVQTVAWSSGAWHDQVAEWLL